MVDAAYSFTLSPRNFMAEDWKGWQPKPIYIDWDQKPRHGKWRHVYMCRPLDDNAKYVLKIICRRPMEFWMDANIIGFLYWIINCDENARERRMLSKLKKFPVMARFFPKFISHGTINGRSAIVVEKVELAGHVIGLNDYVLQYGLDDEMRNQLETICTFMCDNHILCNDLNENNIAISNRSGAIVPMVIDGFGNNHLIPYPVVSKRLNAAKLRRRLARMLRRLDEIDPKREK